MRKYCLSCGSEMDCEDCPYCGWVDGGEEV